MNTGVYKIENLINRRFYIGSTANDFRSRWNDHVRLLRKKKHHNKSLQEDWNKHGEECFVFIILKRIIGVKNILRAEQDYLNVFFDNDFICYNLNKNAVSRSIGRDAQEDIGNVNVEEWLINVQRIQSEINELYKIRSDLIHQDFSNKLNKTHIARKWGITRERVWKILESAGVLS